MIFKKIKNITPVKIKNPSYVDLYSPWDLKKNWRDRMYFQ